MIPFPPVELIHVLLKLRESAVFIRVSRLLLLCLVVLATLGYAGAWVKGLDPSASSCQEAGQACYTGGPLTLAGYVQELGGSKLVLALPIADMIVAGLLLFKARRVYLWLMLVGLFSVLLQLYLHAIHTGVLFTFGSGFLLTQIASFLFGFLAFPMAIVEQSRLSPGRFLSTLRGELDHQSISAPKE